MKHSKLKAMVLAAALSTAMIQPGTVVLAEESSEALSTSFTLDGKEYTLPFDYALMEEDGWITSDDVDTTLGGMTIIPVIMEKEGKEGFCYISLSIYNGSGNSEKVRDCKVSGIRISKANLDNYAFALSNGLKPGDDMTAVTDAMGAPDESTEYDDYTVVHYGDKDQGGEITFTLYNSEEDAENNDIEIENYQTIETETIDEAPDYLNDYTAPEAMSDDITDATVTIDQIVYQLPCPVSVFIDNGWALTDNDPVMSKRIGMSTLEKDGVELDIVVTNFADYQTTTENCEITKLKVYESPEFNPPSGLTLSNGISFASKTEDLDAIDTFEKDDQDSSIAYSYHDSDNQVDYNINYDKESNCVNSIEISKNL